jgi:fibronectin type 3 domain-containing protein
MRISPAGKPVDSPAFRDSAAQPGHEYVYSVTAVDHDGNESAHSAEVKETLPPKP